MGRMGRAILLLVALGLVSGACGKTSTQRAATGGLAGLVLAGPPGAVVGAGLGMVTRKHRR